MKHYFTESKFFSNTTFSLIIIFVISTFQVANAQKLLFPDEFQRLPESDPGAKITAKVLPNSNNKIFYGTIGPDNVVWVNGEPEKLDFPGKILSANADFTYVKGVISENESYYVFKNGEYTHININYAPGFSNLKVVYFSDDGSLIIGTARKSDGTYTRDRAVRITGGNWQVIGDDPPLSDFGSSNVGAVRGENGSIIIGDKYFGGISQAFRLENGTFQYFSYQSSITYARTASPDGNVIAGSAADAGLNNYIAYKWKNGNLTPLPELGGEFSYHNSSSVNNEGDIVTGYAELYTGNYSGNVAFIWSPGDGIRQFSEYVSGEYGISFPGANVSRADLSEDETYYSGTVQYQDRSQRPYILLLNETDDRIVVNSTADRPLNVENSTDCNTGEQIEIDGKMVAECTLRAAIQAAINRFKEETGQSGKISFNIPGTNAHIVAVNSPLPDITEPIEIDGSDEISNTGLPFIYIDGQNAGGGVNGFNIVNDSVTIKKLAIYGFDGHGIYVADVKDIRLEGLIVGSDGNGTENIGNGNDGIHISGNAKIKVGGELMEASPLASGSFGTTVAVLGNKGNGIAVAGTEVENLKSGNTTPFKFQTEEEMEKVFNNLTIGMVKAHSNTNEVVENIGAGAFVQGKSIMFDNSAFGPSGGPALEIIASEAVHVQQSTFGKKNDKISESTDIVNQKSGNIQKSINIQPFIKVLSSRGIMIGSTNASQNPIEAIGSKGFFAEIEDSEDVKVANVISGAVKNIDGISKEMAEQMKNAIGGIRVSNSNRVNIGDKNVPTIITNSGTPGDSSAIGILISGVGTKLLKISNTLVGAIGGIENSGIAGDGIRIENGVSDFTIGGEDEDEKVVVAGNSGYGVHLVNNNNNSIGGIAGRLPSVISNLFTDYSEAGNIETVSPNKLGALKISDSDLLAMKKLFIGPTKGHGIEITGKSSTGISLIQSSIGAIGNQLVESIEQIAGPMKDGIHISEASDIQIGSDITEELVRILGSGGHGLSMNMSKGIKMNQLNIGDLIAEQINEQFSEALLKASNKQGGIFINSSDSIDIVKSKISNNGTPGSGSIGGLVAKLSGTIQIHSSIFGEKVDSVTHTGNHGAAIITEQVKKISISASKVAGNLIGILASDSNIEMEGNTIEEQKGGEGEPGHGLQVKGGFLNASKNTIKNNSGTGVVLEDVFAAVVRINNILSNTAGAMISSIGETKSAGENGSVVYAGENWWGDASGPGGDGPGTGNAVYGDLDFSNWLNAPFGVTVVPKEHLITLTGDQAYNLPVSFANHLEISDQLTVTISDSLGWYSGSNSFSVAVENFEYSSETLSFNPDGSQSNINVVKIHAVSQNNPELTSEVKIYFVPPANILNLENPSLAETNILDTESGPFQIGDEIIIGHGLANEETATIAEFGSIILENPLRFSHAAGERIFTVSNLYTSVNEIAAEIPHEKKTILGNNYPNPFSAKTRIPFEIDSPDHLEINVLDRLGRTVKKLADENFPSGKHEVTFEGSGFPAGMYFYQIKGNNFIETRKMIISK